uniref:Transmembrane protein n=1 Tax=Rhizophora mucronata TaxID=61149 RepID=A0A2P2NJD4_RHIMU
MTMLVDVSHKNLVLVRCPRPFLQSLLITTRRPSHLLLSLLLLFFFFSIVSTRRLFAAFAGHLGFGDPPTKSSK